MKAEINGRIVRLPDFLIVGAAKSGTTSLYHYLKQHPQIFMPEVKEPNFFTYCENPPQLPPAVKNVIAEIITSFDDYVRLFENATENQVMGEASPSYLRHYTNSIKNIKNHVPDWQRLKIIILLRDPTERAFSDYMMYRMLKLETLDFEKALDKEHNSFNATVYIDYGFYYERVKAYLDTFPNLKLYLFDDLKKDTPALVKDTLAFLGVDSSVAANTRKKHNPSGEPKSGFFHKLLTTPNVISSKIPLVNLIPLELRAAIVNKLKMKNLRKPEMKTETRQYLKGLYREDTLKLQELIGRDLTAWLN